MTRPMIGLRVAVVALVVYAAIAVWLTWPLAAQATSHLPASSGACLFDTPLVAWILAHETNALATAPWTLQHGNQYHPAPNALFYGPAALGALPLFAPVFLATDNPALALNVTLIGGAVLTAVALHLVLWWATGSQLAGGIGACTFLTTRWLFWTLVPTATFYACLTPFPFIVAAAATRDIRIGRLLPLVVLQCLSDVAYLAAAVLGPLALIAAVRLFRRTTRAAGLRALAVVALAPVALAPIYAGYMAVARRNPDIAAQTNWRGADVSFPWLGQHLTNLPWGPFDALAPVTVAPVALALAMVGLVLTATRGAGCDQSRRLMTHALAWTLIGLAMSLTPAVEWGGRTVYLPHAWLAEWRAVRAIREPERLAIGALIGVSLLAGLAFAHCVAAFARPVRAAAALLVVGGLYVQYAYGFTTPFMRKALPSQYPTTPAPTMPALVDVLRRDDGPVLELPVGPPGGGTAALFHAPALYRSISHWRPLVNGYDGYWPEGFRERMALALRLPDRDALESLRRETGLETIVVHETLARTLDPQRYAAWLEIADAGGRDDVRLVSRVDQALVFRVAEDSSD